MFEEEYCCHKVGVVMSNFQHLPTTDTECLCSCKNYFEKLGDNVTRHKGKTWLYSPIILGKGRMEYRNTVPSSIMY